MSQAEDETVLRCNNVICPVNWVQIGDDHDNPICLGDIK